MGEAGGVFIGGVSYRMGIYGSFDASISDGLRGVAPGPDGWGVWVGLVGRWEWEIPPPAAWPTGNAAGA